MLSQYIYKLIPQHKYKQIYQKKNKQKNQITFGFDKPVLQMPVLGE